LRTWRRRITVFVDIDEDWGTGARASALAFVVFGAFIDIVADSPDH
jgi:hypothetical protein